MRGKKRESELRLGKRIKIELSGVCFFHGCLHNNLAFSEATTILAAYLYNFPLHVFLRSSQGSDIKLLFIFAFACSSPWVSTQRSSFVIRFTLTSRDFQHNHSSFQFFSSLFHPNSLLKSPCPRSLNSDAATTESDVFPVNSASLHTFAAAVTTC